MSSARAARDADTYASSDWEIHHSLALSAAGERKKSSPNLNPVIIVPVVLFFILGLQFLPEGSAPLKATDYAPSGGDGSIFGSLRGLFQGGSNVKLHSDFQGGIGDWVSHAGKFPSLPSAGTAADWNIAGGTARPGKLRLWKQSLSLADYRFEFQGQIEHRALGWAFRAANVQNYYAAKLALTGASSSQTGEIVRYIVLNGKEGSRSELPLPITIQRDTPYQIRVTVKGDFFATSVNGRVVDTWRDARLRSGGVGFFSDKGESASVRWVTVTATESSFFSRLFAAAFCVSPFDLDEEMMAG